MTLCQTKREDKLKEKSVFCCFFNLSFSRLAKKKAKVQIRAKQIIKKCQYFGFRLLLAS